MVTEGEDNRNSILFPSLVVPRICIWAVRTMSALLLGAVGIRFTFGRHCSVIGGGAVYAVGNVSTVVLGSPSAG